MHLKLTKVFQKVPEGFIGFVEELPGANTQGATLDEVRNNLTEAVELVLEANRVLKSPRRDRPARWRNDGAAPMHPSRFVYTPSLPGDLAMFAKSLCRVLLCPIL